MAAVDKVRLKSFVYREWVLRLACSPNNCVTSFQPSQATSSVCMWFLFVVLNASLACILVRILSNTHLVHVWLVTRNVTNGTSSRRTEIKRTCVTFLPAVAENGCHWTIWNCGYSEFTSMWDKISLLWGVMNGTSFTNICNEYIKDISKMALQRIFKKMSSQNKKVKLMKNWMRSGS